MKKHKSRNSHKTSKSSSRAEVFVLPPDLLVKLGINLSNIQHSEEQSPTTSQVKDFDQNIDHSSSNSLPESEDASSILETANLMKESVFLSPTFLHTASNAVTDEEEPVIDVDNVYMNPNDEVPLKSGDVPYSLNTDTETSTCEKISPELLHGSVIIKSNHGVSVKKVDHLEVFESIEEYQVENDDGNFILTDLPYRNVGDENISNEKAKDPFPVDKHPDEAYLSDCSNSYSSFTPASLNSEVKKQNLLNKRKEIYDDIGGDHPQLKDTQNMYVKCSSSYAIFTPVTTNSIATRDKVCDDSMKCLVDQQSEMISANQFIIEQPVIVSDKSNIVENNQDISKNLISWTPADQQEKEIKITKIDYDAHNKSIIYINDSLNAENHTKNTNVVLVDSECAQYSEKNDFEKSSEEKVELVTIEQENIIKYSRSVDDKNIFKNQNNNLISSVVKNNSDVESNNISVTKNDSVDKVKEIAAYLKIANERKNNIKNKYHNKEKEPKVDPIKSKFCIQGVEKPGGELIQKYKIKCSEVLKTYRRTSKRKQLPELVINYNIVTSDSFQLSNNLKIEKNHDTKVPLRSLNEFCVCYDFGNLAYYDCEMLYEHIHFWPHKSIDCDSEILYSIYNEDYTVSKEFIDFIEDCHQIKHVDNETIRGSLCWNEFNDDEKFTSATNISREAGSSSEQESIMKAGLEMSLPTEIVESRPDKDVDNIAKTHCKRSSVAIDQVCELEDKKKILSMSENEMELHKETDHNSIAWKETDTKSASTTEASMVLPSNSTHEHLSEINDLLVNATATTSTSTMEITHKYKNMPLKSTRTSIIEKDVPSKSKIDFENAEIEVLSKISNNDIDVPSKVNKDPTSFEKVIPVGSTRNKSKTDATSKLSGKSAVDVVEIEGLSMSSIKTFKLENSNSLPDVLIPLTSKRNSIDLEEKPDELPKLTKTSSLNIARNASAGTTSKTNKSKTIKPFESESVSAEVTNTSPSRLAMNINTKNETLRPTTSIKNDSADSLMKCTEDNELIKLTKIKETCSPTKKNTKNTIHNSPSAIDINISTRFLDVIGVKFSSKSLNTVDEEINNESSRPAIRSSQTKSDFSDLSTENNELKKFSNTNESVAPKNIFIENTDSAELANDIDMTIPTRFVGKLSQIESESAYKSTIDSTTSTNAEGSIESSRPTRSLLMKSTESKEYMKLSKIQKDTTNTDSPKDLKASDIESGTAIISTKGSNSTSIEIHIETQKPNKNSSKLNADSDSDSSTKCIENDKLSKTKDMVVPTQRSSENKYSSEVTRAVDINVCTGSKRTSNKETKAVSKSTISLGMSKSISTDNKMNEISSSKRKLSDSKMKYKKNHNNEVDDPTKNTNNQISNSKLDQSLNNKKDLNVSSRLPKESTIIEKNRDDPSKLTKPVTTEKLIILNKKRVGSADSSKPSRKLANIETQKPNKKNLKLDADSSDSYTKCIENDKLSKTKDKVVPTRSSSENTYFSEVTKAVDVNVCTDSKTTSNNETKAISKSTISLGMSTSISTDNKMNEISSSKRKLSDSKIECKKNRSNEVNGPAKTTNNQTSNSKLDQSLNNKKDVNVSSRSPKESTIINSHDPSKLTTPVTTEKSIILNKSVGSADSSGPSRKLANIEICEPSKPTKRSSNTLTVHTPIKRVKPMETGACSTETNISSIISDSEIEKYPNALAIVKHVATKSNNDEQTKDTNEYVSRIQSNNDTIAPNKFSNTEFPSVYSNKQCELTEDTKINSNKNIARTSYSKDKEVELPSKRTETTDMAIVNSSISEELSTNITLNNAQNSPENYVVIEKEASKLVSDNLSKCGVCAKSVEDSQWIEHISVEHDYLAWRDNEPPLNFDDEEALRSYLQVIGKQNDGLKCSKCGLVRKFAKAFMRHIKNCSGHVKDEPNISTASVEMKSSQEQEDDDNPLSILKSRKSRGQRKSTVISVTCGVCNKTIEESEWIEHIRVEHKYLAWRAEENPLNLADEDEVKNHLMYISKNYGGLLCSKCGSKWNYAKKYLLHESLCGTLLNKALDNSEKDKIEVEFSPVVTCGICKLDVEGVNWIKHIQMAHQYLAWIDGETPIDVDDPDEVKAHLKKIIKITGELICIKCGTSRIYPRAYMLHVNACTNSGFVMQITEPETVDKDKYECGVCHEKGKISKWKDHAMDKHYNVAWLVGELPINVRNFYAVEKYLKEYQKKHSLICNHCRAARTSCYGFYAHILTCGKSDEEIDAVHNICEFCNNKYLCVYRNQHLASHRDQEQRREVRELKAKKAAEEASKLPEMKDGHPTGKRKAAEKAKAVIEKYSSNMVDGKPVCSCGLTLENAEESSQHNCTEKKKCKEDDESDVSVKMELESEVESVDTEIDSNVSDCEIEEQRKKKRLRIGEGSTKITRMSYRVNNYSAYLAQGYRDFSNLHYTSETLFNTWRDSEYEVVPLDEMPNYLPPLTESCKVRFGSSDDEEWVTYKQFEAKKVKGFSIFTGGAVQCISWAPPNIGDETLGNYLAVSTHLGTDVPRHGADERPEHPGLVQIWDFRQFNFVPKCVLLLALDYGIVWAMDWCPSGARDRIPNEGGEDDETSFRLGLLAVACSNGTTYIFAVPSPLVQTEEEIVMYKLKPVAELRLSMNLERRVYQATSVKWSPQKGHDTIIVGYSDGTTALYDLNTESPFLKATENNITIFYPFQDKQSESTAITGVGICPSANESYSLGGYFSTSITGGTMCPWPAAAPAVRCHAAVGAAHYDALWPAVMLAGDTPFMKAVTEMEWWGGGRRLGAARASAACVRCGRAAAAAAPAVRLLRHHPCYPELKKLIVATLLMVPVGQKRKRKVNDELSMVVEPLTYEDAVAKYGLELSLVSKNDQAAAQQLCNDNEICPERFPLSDIVSVAFCPSTRFHDKLALATQAGMVFVISI